MLESLSEYLVHLLTHLLASKRLQVPHGRFHVGVTEPLLNCPQIDPRPETSGGECSSEFVQPEILRVELRTLGDSFQTVEKIELRLASGSG